MEAIAIRLEAIASRLEAIASRSEAIAIRLEAIAIRLEAIASRLEAIAIRLEAIASRLEAIASRSEAIASRLEAIGHMEGRYRRCKPTVEWVLETIGTLPCGCAYAASYGRGAFCGGDPRFRRLWMAEDPFGAAASLRCTVRFLSRRLQQLKHLDANDVKFPTSLGTKSLSPSPSAS